MNSKNFEKLVKFVTAEITNDDIVWDIKETENGFNLIFNKKDNTVDNPSERIKKTEQLMDVKLKTQIIIAGRLTYVYEWV